MLNLSDSQHDLRARKTGIPHVKTVKCHPGRSVSLAQLSASRQWLGTVEDTNVIKPQESTLEDVLSTCVFAIYPPERRGVSQG
jgi:hypothetical protein